MNAKLRILILEDQPTDAELILRELRRAGYEAEWKRVETEPEYLAQLEQGWEIILADYNLPQFNGLRALELLKERGLDIPFILVSATIGEDKAVEAMKTGASDYVMKDKLVRLGAVVERELRNASERRERRTSDKYRQLGPEVLLILNEPGDLRDAIQRVLAVLKTGTGFDAVGIRLQEGDDFPYFTQNGFSKEFLLTENTLVERAPDGGVCRDKHGNVMLECTCGLVISGKTNPTQPHFTKGGSFWTNDSFPLLDVPADQDPRLHPRNQCIHQGYASVALIPIRNNDRIVGLIHLNDRRKGCFTLEIVELLETIATHIGTALMRKQAEERLKLSNAILSNLSEGVNLVGLDDGIIKFVNPRFENMFGYDAGELVGKAISVLNAPAAKSPEETEHEVLGILRQTGEWRGNIENIRKDGTLFWCYANVSLIDDYRLGRVCVSVHTDITARKQTEDKLRESEDKFRSYVERSPDGVFVLDRAGRYVEANTAACHALGYTREEIQQLSIRDLLAEESLEDGLAHFKRLIENGEATSDIWHKHKDGSKRCLTISAVRLSETRILGFGKDITARKQAEEKINSQLNELQRWQDVMLGREDRVQELKREVNELLKRMGEQSRYSSQESP